MDFYDLCILLVMINAIWSPCMTLFERKENINKINNLKMDMYERAAIYEAHECHVKNAPLKGYVLSNLLRNLCQEIREHILRISRNDLALARVVLHFKLDSEEKLWFLFCSSVRFEDGKLSKRIVAPDSGYFMHNFLASPIETGYKVSFNLQKSTSNSCSYRLLIL